MAPSSRVPLLIGGAGGSNDVICGLSNRQQCHSRWTSSASSGSKAPPAIPAGVNRVLDVIAAWFEGTGAHIERSNIGDRLGDLLCVRCHPDSREPGILVLSHVDTVHPVGTLAQTLPYRRDGDKVYGPGVYDMKGGLVLAIAAYQRLARAKANLPLPITFLFNSGRGGGQHGGRAGPSRPRPFRNRYVLVTEAQAQRRQDCHATQGDGAVSGSRRTGGPRIRGAATRKAVAPSAPWPRSSWRSKPSPTTRAASPTNVGLINGGNRRQRDPGTLHHRGRRARQRYGRSSRDGGKVLQRSSPAIRMSRSA